MSDEGLSVAEPDLRTIDVGTRTSPVKLQPQRNCGCRFARCVVADDEVRRIQSLDRCADEIRRKQSAVRQLAGSLTAKRHESGRFQCRDLFDDMIAPLSGEHTAGKGAKLD